MNKKELTEADIRTKFITPAILGSDGSKWSLMTQLREEVYFTRGRVIVRGKTVKRGEAKKIDYVLSYKPGIGVNRLLTKSGDIPDSWRRRLNLLLGTEEWYEEFYRSESTPTLFGGAAERVVKASTETIGGYFNNRLKSIFPAVADEPKVLRNSANSPLYLLCFAAGNQRGAPIALRIANHLLKKGTE